MPRLSYRILSKVAPRILTNIFFELMVFDMSSFDSLYRVVLDAATKGNRYINSSLRYASMLIDISFDDNH